MKCDLTLVTQDHWLAHKREVMSLKEGKQTYESLKKRPVQKFALTASGYQARFCTIFKRRDVSLVVLRRDFKAWMDMMGLYSLKRLVDLMLLEQMMKTCGPDLQVYIRQLEEKDPGVLAKRADVWTQVRREFPQEVSQTRRVDHREGEITRLHHNRASQPQGEPQTGAREYRGSAATLGSQAPGSGRRVPQRLGVDSCQDCGGIGHWDKDCLFPKKALNGGREGRQT